MLAQKHVAILPFTELFDSDKVLSFQVCCHWISVSEYGFFVVRVEIVCLRP